MHQTLDELPPSSTIKPRNGFIAFLLSLIVPGLGQVYNGQPQKGAVLLGLLFLVPFLFGLTRASTLFYGLVSVLLIEIVLRLYIIIDSIKNAKRQPEYVLKPYNTWYYHLLIAAGIAAIFVVLDIKSLLGIRTFKIPTTANSPTVQVGDYVVADMWAYKNKEPQYGDITIFTGPDGKSFNYRVVGLPNDTLDLTNNLVRIHGKLGKATFIRETTTENIPVKEFKEELPNGHKYSIYTFKEKFDSTKTNISNIVIPPDCYFVLGDNRDNALDSRYIGFVNKDNIKGRLIFSYWGTTQTRRMNVDFRDK